MLGAPIFVCLGLLLLPPSEAAGVKPEPERGSLEVGRGLPPEGGMLEGREPHVATMADKAPDFPRRVVVVNEGLRELLAATRAQMLLCVNEGVEVDQFHTVGAKSSLEGFNGIHSEQHAADAGLDASLAASYMTVLDRRHDVVVREWLEDLTGDADLLSHGRLRKQGDLLLVEADRFATASLALSSHPEAIAFVGVEVNKVLIYMTPRTDFHFNSIAQAFV